MTPPYRPIASVRFETGLDVRLMFDLLDFQRPGRSTIVLAY